MATKKIPITIARNVQRGIALLTDEQLREIDLPLLDMQDCMNCVLGQVYGEYDRGKKELGLTYSVIADYGFYLNQRLASTPWPVLTQAWKQAITDRLSRSVTEQKEEQSDG